MRHEQGHYDICALMVRDLKETYFDEIGSIQNIYDADSKHSRDGEEQWVWWSVIRRAMELHRVPLTLGPDGRYLKLRLLDALEGAGLMT